MRAHAVGPATVYRYFDAERRLLYVGVTQQHLKRRVQHHIRSGWYRLVVDVSFERHPTRYLAVQAERRAIESESPIHNRQRYRAMIVEGQLDMAL